MKGLKVMLNKIKKPELALVAAPVLLFIKFYERSKVVRQAQTIKCKLYFMNYFDNFFLKKIIKCALRHDRSAVFFFLRLNKVEALTFQSVSACACPVNQFFLFIQRGLGWR